MKAWAQAPETQLSTSLPTPKKESKFQADWRLRMAGNDFQDDQSQSKYVDMRLDLRAKYTLTSSFYLDLQPSVRLVSGQSQTIDGADKMENKILLNQAAAHYNPIDSLRLSAGALSQRYLHSSLLIDDMAFPAARAMAIYNGSIVNTGLAVETAIPTSTSLSTNTKELEPTPSLNTATLLANVGNKDAFWKNRVGYFIYNNLPSAVAQQSLLLGNMQISNESDAKYAFINKFQGIEAYTELQLPVLTHLDLLAGAEYLHNDQVSSEDADASFYWGGGNIHMTKNMDWTLKAGYFSVAPEAAVAYFNSRGFETNRVGYAVETSFSFKKEGFKLGVQYKDAEVMYENPVQSREKFLTIKLETFYANI
ncbi:hypothetical protein [Bdellovibrio sp. NC01]|uniref:hypothetical protein n=1 Tax=Bdellovibrio sp. NC01 TaxID=2220073 RepID=UPI001FED86DE|nr:hypothetical protein [Bdellovibrio sp. NC01]